MERARVGISLTGPTLRALKSIGLIDECVGAAFGFDRIVSADAAGRPFSELKHAAAVRPGLSRDRRHRPLGAA